MNTSYAKVHHLASVRICSVLVQLILATSLTGNPDSTKPTPTAPKTYVLFMGADIALEQDKAIHPVEDVTATSLVINSDDKSVKVSLEDNVNLRISESLKIARTSLAVDGLKAERAYSPWTDPFGKFVRAYTLAAGEGAVVDLARGAALRANAGVMGASAAAGTPEGAQAMAIALAKQAEAESNLSRAESTPTSAAFDVGAQANQLDAAGGEFDAIRLSFEVTSEKDLTQPYYAFIALIKDRDSKPGHVRKWAYVKSLGSMSAGVPRKVNVFRSGLPPGYTLESYEVHLYNGKEELATNLSRKRVPLTSEEAMEFRIIEYIGANKGRTLPAAPALTMLAGEVRASLTAAQLSNTCYIRVAKDGRVAAVFRDAAAKQPLHDPVLEAALKTLRFKPALETGKPVESIVPIKPGQFASP